MEVNGQLQAPATLLPEKEPWYPLDRGGLGVSKRENSLGPASSIPTVDILVQEDELLLL